MELFSLWGTIAVKYADAVNQIDAVIHSADNADDSLDDMEESAEDADSAVGGLGNSAEEADGKFSVWGATLANLAANAIQKVIDKCTELAKNVVTLGKDFTATMSEVQAISGASNEDLQMLEETARKFGATTTFSAAEAAEALKYMSLAGWDAEQQTAALGGILDLAQASGMGLADASDMVTDYLSAFGKEASDSAYFADMLAYAQANSNTTASMLGEAYKNCAANLNAAGQDMETVTALLEAMANQGLKGSEAGTALAATMRDITNAMIPIHDEADLARLGLDGMTDLIGENVIAVGDSIIAVSEAGGNFRDLTEILKDVETATSGMGDAQRAAAMSSTFTAYSIKGMNLMMNEGIDKIAGYEEELRKCGGTASDMAKTMNDNLQGDMASMNSAWEELGLKIYDSMERPLRVMVQAVTGSLIPALTYVLQGKDGAENVLSSALQTLVTKLSVHIRNIAGRVTDAVSVIVSGILKSLPLLIPAVAGIGTTIMDTLSQNVPMIVQSVSDFIQKFAGRFAENLPVVVESALNLITALADGLLLALPELLEKLPDLVQKIADGLLQSIDLIIQTGVTLFVALVDAMPEIISGIVNVLPALITGIVGGLLARLPDLIQAGITLFLALVDALPEIISAITEVLPEIITAIVSAVLENLPAIIDAGFQLFSALIGALPEIISTVAGIVPDIVDGIIGVLPDIAEKFGEFLQNIGNLAPILTGVVTAFLSFKAITGISGLIQNAGILFLDLENIFYYFIDVILPAVPALLSKVSGAFTGLFSVIAANPVAAVIAVIAGLVVAIITLWNTNEDFRNGVIGIWESIQETLFNFFDNWVSGFETIKEFLSGIGSAIGGFFAGIWNFFVGYGESLYDWMQGIKDTVFSAWEWIRNAVATAVNAVSSVITEVFTAVHDFFVNIWNRISNAVQTAMTAVRTTVSNILNAVKTRFTAVWNGIVSFLIPVLDNIRNKVRTGFETVRNTISEKLTSAQNTVSNIFDNIRNAVSNKIESAKNIVKNAIDKIKSFFNFSWSLPELKLPHFNISGEFSLNPPSVPSFGIDWYAKGGIMTEPTVFGYNPSTNHLQVGGEAGAEAVAPIDTLLSYVRTAVQEENQALAEKVETVIILLNDFFPALLRAIPKEVVLDSGETVGSLASRINEELGNISNDEERRRI